MVKTQNTIETVAQAWGLTSEDIIGKRRHRAVADARLTVYWLLRKRHGMGVKAIGRMIGGRCHTTITKGIDAAKSLYATDEHYKQAMDKLETQIQI